MKNGAKETTFILGDIPDVLRRLRKESAMTLRQLSECAGVSVSYLSDIERGKTEPSIEMFTRIVSAHGRQVTFQIASGDAVFSMFGFVETQLLYALERQDFRQALVLIGALAAGLDAGRAGNLDVVLAERDTRDGA